jgi:hypothetical protein
MVTFYLDPEFTSFEYLNYCINKKFFLVNFDSCLVFIFTIIFFSVRPGSRYIKQDEAISLIFFAISILLF